MPTPHPAFENARGIASRPDPSEDFMRFAKDLMSLEKKYQRISVNIQSRALGNQSINQLIQSQNTTKHILGFFQVSSQYRFRLSIWLGVSYNVCKFALCVKKLPEEVIGNG